MKPEDLKKPEGFKSTQREEEQSSTPVANEHSKFEATAGNTPDDDQEAIRSFTAENTDMNTDGDDRVKPDSGHGNEPEKADDPVSAGSQDSGEETIRQENSGESEPLDDASGERASDARETGQAADSGEVAGEQ